MGLRYAQRALQQPRIAHGGEFGRQFHNHDDRVPVTIISAELSRQASTTRAGQQMEADTIPQRPRKVTIALNMLYLSLAIGVTTFLVAWLPFGAPCSVESYLITVVAMIAAFHFRAPTSVVFGGLLIVSIAQIAVVAWLYYMIGRRRNWARVALVVLLILGTLDSLLGVVAVSVLSPAFGHPPASLSDWLTSPFLFQTVLQVAAVILLFGRESSQWFKAVKSR